MYTHTSTHTRLCNFAPNGKRVCMLTQHADIHKQRPAAYSFQSVSQESAYAYTVSNSDVGGVIFQNSLQEWSLICILISAVAGIPPGDYAHLHAYFCLAAN